MEKQDFKVIYDTWDKVKKFMLSISKNEYGVNHDGGKLIMAKNVCIQGKYTEAIEYLKYIYKDKPNKWQLNEFHEKLKTCCYFIDRPIENYDDFLDTHKIISNDGKWHYFEEIESAKMFDFDYLKDFVMDFSELKI